MLVQATVAAEGLDRVRACPSTPVDPRLDLVALEDRVLGQWKDQRRLRRVPPPAGRAPRNGCSTRARRPRTGGPGIHHVWARLFKDIYPRFHTMRGKYVARKAGWDCHGLPVEVEVEKELGFSGKPQIEDFGIEAFNQRCRESVQRYVEDWSALTSRIGMWLDLSDAYTTMSNEFIESVWWLFHEMWDKELHLRGLQGRPLLRPVRHRALEPRARPARRVPGRHRGLGLRPLPGRRRRLRPPRVDDHAVDAREQRRRRGRSRHRLRARARPRGRSRPRARRGPRRRGARRRRRGRRRRSRSPTSSAGATSDRSTGCRRRATAGGSWPPTSSPPTTARGIVHLAPAFGEIDREVGEAEGLPMLNPVNAQARFEPTRAASVAGQFVKEADPALIDELRDARPCSCVVAPYEHSYPHCWRCGTPLIYWAKPTWFARTSEHKDALLRENETIGWHPEHIQHGRFGDWLANNVDWALSRDRFWGTPIPVWRCTDCGHDTCVGSVAELAARAGQDLTELDLHRPFVDDVTIACEDCGGRARARRAGARRVVRLRVDAGRAVALPVRERRRVRAALPRRLHLRGDRPDPRLVLLAARGEHARVRPVAVPQRRLPRRSSSTRTARRCRRAAAT